MAVRSCLSKRLVALFRGGALTGRTIEVRALRVGELLMALSRDRRPLIRRVVAECAQKYESPRRLELLMRLVVDRNAEVRHAAIESLGNILEGKKCPPILFKALHDTNRSVRSETAAVLGPEQEAQTFVRGVWAERSRPQHTTSRCHGNLLGGLY